MNNALRLLAAMLVLAFILCGAHGIRSARSRRTDGSGAFSSTDSFLFQTLGVHGASGQIANAISNLPSSQPLAIIAPSDNFISSFILPEIGSVTWPHPICLIRVDNPELPETLRTLRKDHFAAALFYDLLPPIPNPAVHRVGLLTIVPIPK